MTLTIEDAIIEVKRHDARVAAEKKGLIKKPLGGLNHYISQMRMLYKSRPELERLHDDSHYEIPQSYFDELTPVIQQAIERLQNQGYTGPTEEEILIITREDSGLRG